VDVVLAATRPLHFGAKGEARSDLRGAAACGGGLMAKPSHRNDFPSPRYVGTSSRIVVPVTRKRRVESLAELTRSEVTEVGAVSDPEPIWAGTLLEVHGVTARRHTCPESAPLVTSGSVARFCVV